jgi:hypothetical protein
VIVHKELVRRRQDSRLFVACHPPGWTELDALLGLINRAGWYFEAVRRRPLRRFLWWTRPETWELTGEAWATDSPKDFEVVGPAGRVDLPPEAVRRGWAAGK